MTIYLSIIGFNNILKTRLQATSKKLALDFAAWGTWLPRLGKGPAAVLVSTPFVKTIMQELGNYTLRESPM